MRETLSIKLPELTPPASTSFATNSESVRQWVEKLPLANIGNATQQVYKALCEVNQLDIPASERFGFLEALGEPLEIILPALTRHFCCMAYPLPEKSRKVARLSSRLQAEIVIGYRHILHAAKKAGWFRRHAINKMFPTCVHRIHHYLGGIVLNHNMLYEPVPQGLWISAHRLYRASEKAKRVNNKVVSSYTGNRPTTLKQEYLRLLLLSMIQTHNLRPGQVAEIIAGMTEWTRLTDIIAIQPDELLPSHIYVRLDDDQPPTSSHEHEMRHYSSESRLRRIDTIKMEKLFTKSLQGRGNSIFLRNGERVSRKTLELLLDYWGEPKMRRDDRLPSDESMDVVIGMSALHRMLKPVGMAASTNNAEEIMLGSEEGNLPAWLDNSGNWDEIDLDASAEQQSWVKEFEPEQYHALLVGKVVNQSDGGYCLSLPEVGIERIYAGELIGLRRELDSDWRMASIHWLEHSGDGRLHVGVQVVAQETYPVQIKVKRYVGTSEAIECIVATDEDLEPLIFLPTLPGITSKELLLEHRGYSTPLELHEKVKESAAFEAYTFTVQTPPPEDFDDDEFGGLWLRI